MFPAVTKPPSQQPAAGLKIPGLVLAAPDDAQSLRTDALELAPGLGRLGAEDRRQGQGVRSGRERRFSRVLGPPGSSSSTQRTVRALLTGFLLFHLTGDKAYREFSEADAALPKTQQPDPDAPAVTPEERIVALLK